MMIELLGNSVLLGIGLAMDAFSVSLVNGMNAPRMRSSRMMRIAGVFGCFQFLMPIIGWVCVRTVIDAFRIVRRFIPWIAMGLLAFIGAKMLIEGIRGPEEEQEGAGGSLLLQGIATSIDALSAGLTMADLNVGQALFEAAVIGLVTLAICLGGIKIGKKAGNRLGGKATILGGLILIAIGVKTLLTAL